MLPQKIVIERAIALRLRLEAEQGHLGLAGILCLDDRVGEGLFQLILPLLGNFILALEGLLDAAELVGDRMAKRADLVSNVDDRLMIGPIPCGVVGLSIDQLEVPGAQSTDNSVAHLLRNAFVSSRVWPV